MYTLPFASTDQLDGMVDDSSLEERVDVLSNSFDTPWQCGDKGVLDRACDGARERSEGSRLKGRRK